MKLFFFVLLLVPSLSFAICCNSAGNPVNGIPFQTQQGCLTQTNINSGFFWSNGSQCPKSGNCCKVKTPVQGVYVDCAELETMLTSMSGADTVGRCNQINGGQSCQWTCNSGAPVPSPAAQDCCLNATQSKIRCAAFNQDLRACATNKECRVNRKCNAKPVLPKKKLVPVKR